jgi:hypothetical protein
VRSSDLLQSLHPQIPSLRQLGQTIRRRSRSNHDGRESSGRSCQLMCQSRLLRSKLARTFSGRRTRPKAEVVEREAPHFKRSKSDASAEPRSQTANPLKHHLFLQPAAKNETLQPFNLAIWNIAIAVSYKMARVVSLGRLIVSYSLSVSTATQQDSSARSKSVIRSSVASRPTDSLISPSPIPAR